VIRPPSPAPAWLLATSVWIWGRCAGRGVGARAVAGRSERFVTRAALGFFAVGAVTTTGGRVDGSGLEFAAAKATAFGEEPDGSGADDWANETADAAAMNATAHSAASRRDMT
jgi:hypothetical protein